LWSIGFDAFNGAGLENLLGAEGAREIDTGAFSWLLLAAHHRGLGRRGDGPALLRSVHLAAVAEGGGQPPWRSIPGACFEGLHRHERPSGCDLSRVTSAGG
jgi:hypothetical protein